MVQQLPPARGLQPRDTDELLIPLASGVKELLFAPVNPFNNRPGFIAGPTPATGLARAVQGVSRLNCRIWASRDKSGYSPRVNQYNGDVCGPYLDDLGENPFGGFVGPAFRGGQCQGVLYAVTFEYNLIATDGTTIEPKITATSNAIGPISGIRGFGLPEFQNIVIDSGVGPDFVRTGSCPQGCYRNIRLISIARVDGSPDGCGNVPTVVQPPGTVTPGTPIVPNIDIDLPGVGPINITVDIDADGNPVIIAPDIDGEITIAPDVEFGGGDDGGGGDPGDPTDPGSPGGSEGTGLGGDAEGQAPPGQELVGLLVTVAEAPGDANKFANNSKQPFRGIGYVRMGYPNRLGLDISGGTVISPQFFHAQQRGLTNWAVAANTGFDLTIQPYYRDIET